MHVLVGRCRAELAGRDLLGQLVEPGHHPRQLVRGQQAGPMQRPSVGPGTGDVVTGQPPVELGGDAEREHRVGGSAGEPATPEPTLMTAVRTGRHQLTDASRR